MCEKITSKSKKKSDIAYKLVIKDGNKILSYFAKTPIKIGNVRENTEKTKPVIYNFSPNNVSKTVVFKKIEDAKNFGRDIWDWEIAELRVSGLYNAIILDGHFTFKGYLAENIDEIIKIYE